MNRILAIRKRLGLSQTELARAIGCSQGNVGHYEVRGQTVPPEVARRLIDVAGSRGLRLSFDHIYGELALPDEELRHAA